MECPRQETDETLDGHEEIAPFEKVKYLPYLRSCLDESLRITPPKVEHLLLPVEIVLFRLALCIIRPTRGKNSLSAKGIQSLGYVVDNSIVVPVTAFAEAEGSIL